MVSTQRFKPCYISFAFIPQTSLVRHRWSWLKRVPPSFHVFVLMTIFTTPVQQFDVCFVRRMRCRQLTCDRPLCMRIYPACVFSARLVNSNMWWWMDQSEFSSCSWVCMSYSNDVFLFPFWRNLCSTRRTKLNWMRNHLVMVVSQFVGEQPVMGKCWDLMLCKSIGQT